MPPVQVNTPPHPKPLTVTEAARILGVGRPYLSQVLNGHISDQGLYAAYQKLLVSSGLKPEMSREQSQIVDLQRHLLSQSLQQINEAVERSRTLLRMREDFASIRGLATAFYNAQREVRGVSGFEFCPDPESLAIEGGKAIDGFLQTQDIALQHLVRDGVKVLRCFNPDAAAQIERLGRDSKLSVQVARKLINREMIRVSGFEYQQTARPTNRRKKRRQSKTPPPLQ